MKKLQGLSNAQVEERARQGQINRDTKVATKTVGRIFLEHTLTLFNVLNFVLALSVLLVGSPKNMLFMFIVLANTGIGIVQEIRSKRMVDKLSLMIRSKVEVIREGKSTSIDPEEIVLGDLLRLRRGMQVPADCTIMEGEASVNESLITGEADLLHKKSGDPLFSGSFVSGGECLVTVTAVGGESFAMKLSKEAKTVKRSESEIMRSLRRIITIISCVIIPLGVILYLNQISLPGITVQEAVVSVVAALIGMIPEGLMLLTSSVLAVAVIRLSRKNVLVQELYCIETLARVDVLCLDKTGTITSGRMKVKALIGLLGNSRKDLVDALSRLLGAQSEKSPTVDALTEAFGKKSGEAVLQQVPFSSERKWSGCRFESGETLVMGAGEMLFPDSYDKIRRSFESQAGMSRVIVLAASSEPFTGEEGLPKELRPLGAVLIDDEIRPEAPETLAFFQEQGVQLKVISGDSPLTVSRIAERAGVPFAERYIDMSRLQTDEEVHEAAGSYTVFGRVSPAQKRLLVRALQKQGHTVAMTGDGVNDVLAMKEADCSVAMAEGSEAARNLAQLVLTTNDFSSMPKVVAEGRRSINNIQRSASLFLMKTIFSILLGILFTFVNLRYPFQPIQLSFVSTLAIGIPSVVLALEPNHERIQGRFFYNVLTRALSGGLAMTIGILLCYAAGALFSLSYEEVSTAAVLTAALVGLYQLFRISLPFNVLRGALFAGICVLMFLGVFLGGEIFSFAPLRGLLLAVLLGIGALSGGIFFVLYHLLEKLREKKNSPEAVREAEEKNRLRLEQKAKRRYDRLYRYEKSSSSYKGLVRIAAYPVSWIRRIVAWIRGLVS